jgi:hypothetical protein
MKGLRSTLTAEQVAHAKVLAMQSPPVIVGPPQTDRGCGSCLRCVDRVPHPVTGLPESCHRMVVCSGCGNKRCPHATDHRLACTGSNDPGQPGSDYPSTEALP